MLPALLQNWSNSLSNKYDFPYLLVDISKQKLIQFISMKLNLFVLQIA